MKKIKLFSFLTLVFFVSLVLLPASKVKASSSNSYEDINNIPIIGYEFIYIETTASLVDFKQNLFDKFKATAESQGVKCENMAILYLDSTGFKAPEYPDDYFANDNNAEATAKPAKAETKPEAGKEESASASLDKKVDDSKLFTTDENNKIDIKDLIVKYNKAFLTAQRRAYVGCLLPISTVVTASSSLKVAYINQVDAMGFQVFPPSHYVTEDDGDKEKAVASEKKEEVGYPKEVLIKSRVGIIQYMNIMNKEYIGMLEFYDFTGSKLYSYLALPGKISELHDENVPKYIPNKDLVKNPKASGAPKTDTATPKAPVAPSPATAESSATVKQPSPNK